MSDDSERHYDASILGIDVKGYSERDVEGQRSAQELIDRVLARATARAKRTVDHKDWLDGGDGGYYVLGGDLTAAFVVMEQFVGELERANRERREDLQVHVRYALHSGDVATWMGATGPRFASKAINECARLLGGMNREHLGQVVCSDVYRGRLMLARVHADHFVRLRDTTDKHGHAHAVWNVRRAPGFGIEPPADELHGAVLSDNSLLRRQQALAQRHNGGSILRRNGEVVLLPVGDGGACFFVARRPLQGRRFSREEAQALLERGAGPTGASLPNAEQSRVMAQVMGMPAELQRELSAPECAAFWALDAAGALVLVGQGDAGLIYLVDDV